MSTGPSDGSMMQRMCGHTSHTHIKTTILLMPIIKIMIEKLCCLCRGNRHSCLLCLILSATVFKVVAQTETVSGIVVDENHQPLTGVTINIKDGETVGLTDASGKFSLSVAADATLVFTYVGYVTKEINMSGQRVVDVQLVPDASALDEVVVVGYSARKKADLTGAIAVVKVEDMLKQPSGQVTNQLQGQASGITVLGSGQPGQEPNVTIRGVNTFGNNNPLYVVDGVPITDIGNLNPNDVESMQVLKDAGSASIYGSRAANGVIIITTKRGSGKPQLSYDAFQGIQVPMSGNVWNKLNTEEMA